MQINTHLGIKFGKAPYKALWLSAFLYLLVFVLYSFPLVENFSAAFISPAQNGDPPVFVWNVHQFSSAIEAHENPFYTYRQIAPVGGNLIMHSNTLVFSIANLVFNNPEFSVNFVLALSFILSGIGAFFLTYRACGNVYWSFLSGFFFAFSPYKTAHLVEHFNLMLTATIPFFALSFIRTFDFVPGKFWPNKIHLKWLLWSFSLGILAFLSDYYTTFFMLYLAMFVWLYNAFVAGKVFRFNSFTFWLKTVAVLVISHFIIRLLRLTLDDNAAFWLGGDLLQYAIPSHNSAWFGSKALWDIKNTIQPYAYSIEYEMFLGWSFLLVAIFAAILFIQKKNKLGIFSFLSLVFAMLCIPALKVYGKEIFNLPTSVLHFVPFFNHVHVPPRFVLMLGLVLPISVALPFALNKGLKWLPIALFFVLLIEFLPQKHSLLQRQNMPAWVPKVKNSKAEVLVPIPTGLRDGLRGYGSFNSNHLYYQLEHQKPIVGGYLSRLPLSTYEVYKTTLGLKENGCIDEKVAIEFPNAVYVIDSVFVKENDCNLDFLKDKEVYWTTKDENPKP